VVCAVVENGSQRMTAQGAPDFRLFVLGRSQWETKDTWDVSGLIGSGSHGVAAQNAFVPDELVAGIEGPVHINRPLYQGYMPALVLPGCSAVVLGVAQAAIEETVALAPSKRTLLGGILAESAHAQEVIAQSEAALQAARLLLYSAAAALDTACERSEPVTMQQRASLRAAMSHGAQVSRKVLMDMYELGGSSALYRGNSVERLFRDGMVALQHGNHNTSLFEAVGRVRLGMAPGRMLF
jgi:alkylation response protein AidB-like acyl-CoA dehydrogenase